MVDDSIEMKSLNKHNSSREGLLRSEKAAALRPSLEEAYRSSLDSDEPLDSLDLNADERSWESKRGKWSCLPTLPPWSSGYTYEHSQHGERPKLSQRPRWLSQRKSCFLVVLILALGLLGLVGSGALWVYHTAPNDGVGATADTLDNNTNLTIYRNPRHGIQLLEEAR